MEESDNTLSNPRSFQWGISPRILCICCTAAMVAETVTYPLDMLKTRIQVFGELKRVSHPGVVNLGFSIIRNEGISQLWRGLSPALLRHLSTSHLHGMELYASHI
ncbi:unnamed protein product [Dicrocoelium dendriticum]|nr:unnamed protein product [Dicrocoelium dendriticum]